MIKELFENHIKTILNQYNTIMAEHNIDGILIHSGSLTYRYLDDLAYPFKVNPIFNHMVPIIDIPDCFIFIQQNSKPVLFFYKPLDYWHKMPEDPNGFWTAPFDIFIISDVKDIQHNYNYNFNDSIYMGPAKEKVDFISFKEINPDYLINELHFIRAAKTEYEVYCIKQANIIAARAHNRAKAEFLSGKSEYEINQAYLNEISVNESDSPYGNIVAINENASTLHYTVYEKNRLKDNPFSFLIDAGAQYNGYASDITRTYSFNESDEFHELVKEFDKEQLQLIDTIELDKPYTEMQVKSHTMVASILNKFNFVDLSIEDILSNHITHHFYPHGIGHFLGLQVHDVGGYLKSPRGTQISPPEDHPFLRLTRVIKQNHIFTIEPGLYFIDSLLNELKESESHKYVNWDKVNSFRKFGGIRIEDNIRMKANGIENLTRDAFNEIS